MGPTYPAEAPIAAGAERPAIAASGPYARCGAGIVDSVSGEIDAARYEQAAGDWSKEAVRCRLGPTWAGLHNGDTVNDAPEVWGPAGRFARAAT
ncbi:hypothetical protein SAMN02745121_02888 [Nannocystis exedens]|uniref:Uncharacterized protein n=1 Tax=Nannocystis exedens TaxID=54 RepID=A0A1I1XN47_9BACT|nr:hypothetical protein NAEX_06471 [Nannocystis exedens]SFE07193.1 hypothetical protein SAMN02745121_02888 [Nannocystis exedens]